MNDVGNVLTQREINNIGSNALYLMIMRVFCLCADGDHKRVDSSTNELFSAIANSIIYKASLQGYEELSAAWDKFR